MHWDLFRLKRRQGGHPGSSQIGAKYRRWEEQVFFASLGVLGKPLSTNPGEVLHAHFHAPAFHLSSSPCNSIPLHTSGEGRDEDLE